PLITGLVCWLACGIATAQADVDFTEYSPLSSNAELARRLLSPLAATAVEQRLARSGKQLVGQPLDITREKFTLYVPPSHPPAGYGVFVFVSPWDDGHLPPGWATVLDAQGIIYVSASHSGNKADVLTRRAPLAVLAATNVIGRYPVD